MKCQVCNTENPDGTIFCSTCGTYLGESKTIDLETESALPAEEVSKVAKETVPIRETHSLESPPLLKKSKKHQHNIRSTDVNLIISGVIAAILTVVSYFAGLNSVPIFSERGWVPYAITALSWWCLVILLLKISKLLIQLSESKIIPAILDPIIMIKQSDVKNILTRIESKLKKPFKNIYFNRIKTMLNYYNSQGNVQDVGNVQRYQADIDAGTMESSYMVLKVLIWAIPILGFIGTVLGIAQAVGSFSNFLNTVNIGDLNKQISTGLGGVTTGLGTAFDTTMLALILSIPIMILTSALQKLEDAHLITIENYCVSNVLRKLQPMESLQAILQKISTGEMEKQVTTLNERFVAWINGFRTIIDKIADEMKTMDDKIADTKPIVDNFVTALNHSIENFGEKTTQLVEPINLLNEGISTIQPTLVPIHSISQSLIEEREILQKQGELWVEGLDKIGQNMVDAYEDHYRKLSEQLRVFIEKENQILPLIKENLESLASSDGFFKEILKGVHDGLQKLNPTLDKLSKPTVIKLAQE